MIDKSTRPHWVFRSMGSTVGTPVLLIALVGMTLWSFGRAAAVSGDGGHPLAVMLVSLAAVAIGCAALAWVRPQRAGLSPPHVMLSLGFGGMLIGLMVDLYHAGPARLDSLCAQSTGLGFMDSLEIHLQFLPGMHAGMLVGGLAAIPSLRLLRSHCGRYLCSLFAQNLLCASWMLVGMTVGAVWLSRWQVAAGASTLPGMLGGMFAGMTWGMVVSVALYRGFFTLRNRAQMERTA